MALSIYTNNYSTIAQNSLSKATNSLSKSIERLSTGLRINNGSDDASGLAISEKLRGQIRGLAQASSNAQDATSMLQTADGGMGVITDMLQRMRELAVQAGNGAYTANDRKELQKEVDQLKAEINRTSASTEFNTKKILTGDAAGLWSTNAPESIEAILRGAPAEGNYRLDVTATNGQNFIYKSNIMSVEPEVSFAIADIGGLGGYMDETFEAQANVHVTIAADGNADNEASIAAIETVGAGVVGDAGGITGGTLASTAEEGVSFINKLGGSGTFVIQANTTIIESAAAVATAADFTVTYIKDNGAVVNLKDLGMTIGVTTANGSLQLVIGTGETDEEISFELEDAIDERDALSVKLNGGLTATDKAQVTLEEDDGTEVIFELGVDSPATFNGTIVSLQEDGSFTTNRVAMGLADATAGEFGVTRETSSTLPTLDTRLSDITKFTNADGRNLLDNTQEITIFGNDKTAVFSIEGGDTVQDLVNKLNTALVDLGMGTGDPAKDAKMVQFVDAEGKGGLQAVGGTLVFQGALIGDASKISFMGDEGVLNALGITTLQEGKNSDLDVTVTDAHTGKLIGSDRISDNMLRGVIDGVDVLIKNPTMDVTYDADAQKFAFAAPAEPDVFNLHIVDNRTEVQIGANEGQKFDITIGRVDTTSLEIDDAFVLTMDESQKAITKFDQAIEKVSSARATIGAQVNRMSYAMQNLATSRQNLEAAESRIRDIDVASESAALTRNQILQNSAIAMLAQANQMPQVALQLLG